MVDPGDAQQETGEGQPVEVILARHLLAAISVPGFVVNTEATIVFFNDEAGDLIGRHFEDVGRLSAEEWSAIGPLDKKGRPLAHDDAPMRLALEDQRPSHSRFFIRTDADDLLEVETTALPLVGEDLNMRGALLMFWRCEDD